MEEVKILVYTSPVVLEREINLSCEEFGYSLQGNVTVGMNHVGHTIYVATLVKGGSK